jgi:hypothetical protein
MPETNSLEESDMKLKITLLVGLFAAGACASLALADDGGKKTKCKPVHLSGTVAPQSLAVTLDHASAKGLLPAGSTLQLAVGATGQTVRLKAEACATGTAGAVTLTVKRIELAPAKAASREGTGTATDDDHGKGHKGKGSEGGGTTSTTTAPATTTAP